MALIKRNPQEIAPQGFERLSEQEALNYQLETILNWEPQSQVWPFRFSVPLLATAGALSGIYINRYYRQKMHLGNMAKISTYIPIVALPAMVSALWHQQAVTSDVLIEKTPCPLCVQLRAAAIQATSGVIYPLILAPLATFTFASRLRTFNMPYLTSAEGRTAALHLWKKITQPIVSPILAMITAQAIIATFLTLSQQNTVARINAKLLEKETQNEDMAN